MAETADVQSIEAIRDVRAALCLFAEEAKAALDNVDFEVRRTVEWLTNEQRLFWQGEIKRWYQKLNEAKAELTRKKLGKFGEHKPDTTQEEKKVRMCELHLEEAHRKLDLCKKWLPEFQHAVQEYRGQAQPLADMIDVDVPRGVARLDRMIDALESYLRVAAPTAPAAAALGLPEAGASAVTREPPPEPPPNPGPPPSSGVDLDERERGLE